MEKIPAPVGFHITPLCRAATPMSGLSVAQGKGDWGDKEKEYR